VPNPPEPPSPPPSPENAPPPSPADSSPASARASQSEPGFVADAGPAFNPEAAGAEMPPPPPAAERAVEMLEEWEEAVIGSLLGVKGRMLHATAGVSDQDWVYTDLDLQAIVPPLTRIFNRYEPIRKYAPYADPLTLFTAFSAYVTRSALERREELQVREAEAEGGTVPIEPAEEAAPPNEAPSPETPPRQAASFPTSAPGAPPPMQPSEGPAPARPARPAEAPIDPTAVAWEVGG
jgi:hypothetical protein